MKRKTLFAWHAAALLAVGALGYREVIAAECMPHVHVGALHAEGGYENTTPGLGVLCREGDALAGAGVYRNSVADTSLYAIVGWQPLTVAGVRLGGFLGVVNGYPYRGGAFFPFGGAVASVPVPRNVVRLVNDGFKDGEIHLNYMPKVRDVSPHTLAISATARF